jgi:hypothetical protein
MAHRTFPTLTITALALLSSGCARKPADEPGFRGQAQSRISSVAEALQGRLEATLTTEGPVAAIRVCKEEAPAIAARFSTDGWTVRRIGTRVRNAETNVPTEAEEQILGRFAALPADERATAFEEGLSDDGYYFYKPIFAAKPACLICHGPSEQMSEELRATLAEAYPEDKATGYALGDLRGAFVAAKR